MANLFKGMGNNVHVLMVLTPVVGVKPESVRNISKEFSKVAQVQSVVMPLDEFKETKTPVNFVRAMLKKVEREFDDVWPSLVLLATTDGYSGEATGEVGAAQGELKEAAPPREQAASSSSASASASSAPSSSSSSSASAASAASSSSASSSTSAPLSETAPAQQASPEANVKMLHDMWSLISGLQERLAKQQAESAFLRKLLKQEHAQAKAEAEAEAEDPQAQSAWEPVSALAKVEKLAWQRGQEVFLQQLERQAEAEQPAAQTTRGAMAPPAHKAGQSTTGSGERSARGAVSAPTEATSQRRETKAGEKTARGAVSTLAAAASHRGAPRAEEKMQGAASAATKESPAAGAAATITAADKDESPSQPVVTKANFRADIRDALGPFGLSGKEEIKDFVQD